MVNVMMNRFFGIMKRYCSNGWICFISVIFIFLFWILFKSVGWMFSNRILFIGNMGIIFIKRVIMMRL